MIKVINISLLVAVILVTSLTLDMFWHYNCIDRVAWNKVENVFFLYYVLRTFVICVLYLATRMGSKRINWRGDEEISETHLIGLRENIISKFKFVFFNQSVE